MKAGIIELDLKIRFIKVWLSPSQKIVLFASMKAFKNYENAFYFTLKALFVLNIFLATESLLKMMKNAFYFTLKALFVLKVFKILSGAFTYVGKWLD